MVLKQDKCRGVIVRNIQIGSKKYKGKYLNLLYPDNFIQLENDPTKTILPNRLYPPTKFYFTVKQRKLKNGSSVGDLTLRPIISCVGRHHIYWLNTCQNCFLH